MSSSIPHTLKHRLRHCAHCRKNELEEAPGVRFRICGKCKIHLYCSTECQRADWPSHKLRCSVNAKQREITREIDANAIPQTLQAGQMNEIMPLDGIYPILNSWTATYRPLLCLSLLNALGRCDTPPGRTALTEIPKVFMVYLSVIPGISQRTKPRTAFTVDDVEVVSLDEFRVATTNRSHRLYNYHNAELMVDCDRHRAQMGRERNRRLTMVVQRVYFHNGVSSMNYSKNWYLEDNSMRDYSKQWKPDDWLSYLKETVARGKGWNKEGIQF
ncbi:hypothetical protein BDZ94DRAFT_1326022 [Collybia nuda]|uniref:MYND-type domain-containing protein n=1 Tax=Collybia nuda TaxID=64659 RepID=A0A9P5XVY3_9AGAR|nr:hypothetical protein BDZ94DRAFT_1326022 [Collybia nuda]